MSTSLLTEGIGAEIRLILRRTLDVRRLVPRRDRWALGGAAAIMAMTSATYRRWPSSWGAGGRGDPQ